MKKLLTTALVVALLVAVGFYAYRTFTQPRGGTSSLTLAADPCNINGQVYCALNPDVTQSSIDRTICVSGWTSKVRPSVTYTNTLKRKQLGPGADLTLYEEDHRMPLEMGGAPSDVNNLSPERYPEAYAKDHGENQGKADVCSHTKTLAEAQAIIVRDWLAVYPNYK